jgi:hypothetical protein
MAFAPKLLWMTEALNISHRNRLRRQHWPAWMALCVVLAIHVADEALTGFLEWYNPTVRAMREKHPLLYSSPLLIAASIALIAYTRAYQRARI